MKICNQSRLEDCLTVLRKEAIRIQTFVFPGKKTTTMMTTSHSKHMMMLLFTSSLPGVFNCPSLVPIPLNFVSSRMESEFQAVCTGMTCTHFGDATEMGASASRVPPPPLSPPPPQLL